VTPQTSVKNELAAVHAYSNVHETVNTAYLMNNPSLSGAALEKALADKLGI
jgi:hypothetical protein